MTAVLCLRGKSTLCTQMAPNIDLTYSTSKSKISLPFISAFITNLFYYYYYYYYYIIYVSLFFLLHAVSFVYAWTKTIEARDKVSYG